MRKLYVFLVIVTFLSILYGCSEDTGIEAITKPELSLPKNQDFVFDNVSAELKWKNSNSVGLTGPIIYTIYLDKNPFPTTAIGTSRLPNFTVTNLTYNTTYFWRVDATASGVTESSANVYSFTIKKTLDTERAALVSLFNMLGGNNWNRKNNWNSSNSISTWHGVKVDNSGFVTELKLPNNNLTGSVPDDIENLTHLRVLDFSGNKFNNNISSKIGNLANLDSLSLRNAKLTGTIPTELSNLAALKYLYLDNNTLVGPIPDKFGDLKNLLVLYINSNDLSGEIPTTLGNLRQLQQIYARDNVLSGPIPYALANIPALNTFVFDNNHLSGTLPDFSNTSMRTFLIHENPDLTGSLRASGLCKAGNTNVTNTGITPCLQ